MAASADIRHDDAFLEAEGSLQFVDRLLGPLLAQIQVGHDFVVIGHLILRSFEGAENIERLVDHFQPVVQLAQIELDDRVMRVTRLSLVIDP